MKETQRIQDQLRFAYLGGAWHGPALKEVLADVDASMARARPVPAAHSIWELVRHLIAWQEVGSRRLAGEHYRVSPEENWQIIADHSESAWSETLKNLEAGYERLSKALEKIDDDDLERAATGEAYTNYYLLHGIIQHHLYHAGQIAILKKAQMTVAARSGDG